MRSRRDILKAGSALLPVPWLPVCGSSSSGNGGVDIRSFSRQSAWTASQHLRYSFLAARSTLARLEAVCAAERMLAENHVHNWRQIEADTRLRNARCMGETLWHMHV